MSTTEKKQFWVPILIQVVMLVSALAVSFGYQRSEVASVKGDVARIDRRVESDIGTFRELTGKIEALTAEVRMLNQLMTEGRNERIQHKR